MTSPDGTRAFPPGQIIDPAGLTWAIGLDNALWRKAPGGQWARTTWSALEQAEIAGAYHVKSPTGGFWWRWGGSAWTRLTTADPAPAMPPLPAVGDFDTLTDMVAAGWATAPVDIFIDNVRLGQVTPNEARPDVVIVFPTYPPNTGWRFKMPKLPLGEHTVSVRIGGVEAWSSPKFLDVEASAVPFEIWSRTPGPDFDLLAPGDSIDLRNYVYDRNHYTLTFVLNPASAPIDGIAALTGSIVTRTGPGDLSGVLFDVEAA